MTENNVFSSLQAEQAVLGSLMIDNNTWDVISDRLTAHDFNSRNHQIIFSVIKKIAETPAPFDIITLSEELKNIGELENLGGLEYLVALFDNTPTSKNISAYADILIRKSLRRRINKVTVEMNELSHVSHMGNDELLEQIERSFSEITESNNDKKEIVGIRSSLVEMVDRLEKRFESDNAMTGMPTGIIELDKITHGLQSKDLIVLAARPSMGKTAFLMRIVEATALQQSRPNVLVFSLEMPESSLTERMAASVGRIELDKMRTGKLEENDWSRLTAAISVLSDTKIHYCDASSVTISAMRTIIRRIEREHGKLSLVAVDYLQLIDERGESQTHSIAKISSGLKKIAKDFDVPMLALSQLNRGLESRADKRPMMADLRQSGQIEQDADLIMFLYRDEVYNKESQDNGVMEIIVGKHRNGEIGTVRSAYLGEFTRVENLQCGYGYGN
jgi:replicative DNA helicase